MTHNGTIETEFTGNGYTATCSCGWQSDEYGTYQRAEAELAKHYDEVSL